MSLPFARLTTALLLTCAPLSVHADEVIVFAAASMTNAMAEIEQGFEADTGHDLIVSLAGSSALARQIQQGAPADVFISANSDWMDVLENGGLLTEGSRFDLLTNTLVLIAHGQDATPMQISELPKALGTDRLAMALVDAVPAGIYGKSALEALGLWDQLSPLVAQADNVRAALALVALGETPFGIVYATDAVAEDDVRVVATFPADTHPPIIYPAAAIAEHGNAATQAFLDYLHSDPARVAFDRQGFVVMP